ncbi:something about silencing protein 10 [Bacillus rossius redtenbacheri]|uniref:something about silencing protein 10 n=1 Tax=Bacillus rossius redtenbacheri TaxID=93214 RepID=UPI002FDDB207
MSDSEDYVPSDSEDEYSENEKILLDQARKSGTKDDESEEEVYGLHSSEDGSDPDDDQVNIESDLDGEGGDGLPDVRAWGRDKGAYYHTDYVDQDYGGFDGKDAVAAEYEEQEARAIQKRLAEQLDDEDFSLDVFVKKPESKEPEKEEEIIQTDPTKLTKRQKLELLQKESPEFFGLTEDFKEKMTEVDCRLSPVLGFFKDDQFKTLPAVKYVRTKYHIILNYCSNIAFYLLLKARRVPVQFHPVLRRLYQYRQLLKQLEPVDKEVMDSQIDTVLAEIREGRDPALVAAASEGPKKSSKKLLKLLAKRNKGNTEEDKELQQPPSKKMKAKVKDVSVKTLIDEDQEEDAYGEENEAEADDTGAADDAGEEEGKRAITYQMAKNRGLTPYRKKELRNPRVKHRIKYRKAKIRRKGQVREPRHELQRYGGEISGIKASVTRSIKIK